MFIIRSFTTVTRGLPSLKYKTGLAFQSPQFSFCTAGPVEVSLDEVEGKIYQLLRLLPKCKADKISKTATFEDLGFDSLDTVETIVSIQEMFGIDLPDKEAQSISDVKSAIETFHRHLSELNKPKPGQN